MPSKLQGISCLGLGLPALGALLADTCNLAAFDSLVAGLLPPMDRRGLDNLLASFGWVAWMSALQVCCTCSPHEA